MVINKNMGEIEHELTLPVKNAKSVHGQLINNWFNEWSGKVDSANAPVQAIEVIPSKKIVWALRAWTAPADLGPSTTIQLLDE